MSEHTYVDIPPAVRRQAQALFNQAADIYRVLGHFMTSPELMKIAKKQLKALRAEALALSKEL